MKTARISQNLSFISAVRALHGLWLPWWWLGRGDRGGGGGDRGGGQGRDIDLCCSPVHHSQRSWRLLNWKQLVHEEKLQREPKPKAIPPFGLCLNQESLLASRTSKSAELQSDVVSFPLRLQLRLLNAWWSLWRGPIFANYPLVALSTLGLGSAQCAHNVHRLAARAETVELQEKLHRHPVHRLAR